MQFTENKTYDELKVGDSASLTRVLRQHDIELFAVMSGDVNPIHLDAEYARDSAHREVIAHGMWGGALISGIVGSELPGPGTIYVTQTLRFQTPVGIGDTVTVRVTVASKGADRHVVLDCHCENEQGEVVITGQAEVIAPDVKVRLPAGIPARSASA